MDPAFYSSQEPSGVIAAPEVLSRTEEDGVVSLAVRYRFTGNLSRAARAVLDPQKLTWVIESRLHRSEHSADFVMLPDHYADRLDCAGRYLFEERGGHSVQVVDGELRVHVPVVAGAVERAIVSGLRQNMAEHARQVTRWAERRPSDS